MQMGTHINLFIANQYAQVSISHKLVYERLLGHHQANCLTIVPRHAHHEDNRDKDLGENVE